MAVFLLERFDDDRTPSGALAYCLSFKKDWTKNDPMRHQIYLMNQLSSMNEEYSKAAITIVRKFSGNDLTDPDAVVSAAEERLFEMVYTCILPFEWSTSCNSISMDPLVNAAYHIANRFEVDISDPDFSSLSPAQFGKVERLVQFLRQNLFIGWTSRTASQANSYKDLRLPVKMLREPDQMFYERFDKAAGYVGKVPLKESYYCGNA